MICLNCGHKNPESNKFCGECGTQVHPLRRKEDLERAAQFTVPVNLEQNGVTLPSVSPNPADAERTTVTPVVTQVSQPRQNPLVGENRPIRETNRIAGPSLLGLSMGDEERPGAEEPSNYLLEEPERRANWRAILAIIVLAVVGILFYLEWDSIKTAASDTAVKNGLVQPNPKPAAGTAAPPVEPTKTMEEAAPAGKDTTAPTDYKSESAAPEQTGEPAAKQDNVKNDDDNSTDDDSEPEQKPSASPAQKAAQPSYDNSQVQLAEQYLQGRGVPQNCEMGVNILQRAAATNPRARIQLGALYATGHCVDRDPAEAYHWFARAKQLEPHNTWLDRNMRSLMESMNEWDRRKALALARQDAPIRAR
jgi:hypothetical protein